MKSKVVYLILGSIGSGKSSIASLLYTSGMFKNIEFVSADLYKVQFFNDNSNLSESYRLARLYMNYKIEKLIASNYSFAIEMVPSKQEKIDLIEKLKTDYKYKIISIFIGTSTPLINLSRVTKRVSEGADKVKESKILERHSMSFISIFQVYELSNEIYFLDNSANKLKLLGCKSKNKLHVFQTTDWFNKYVLNRSNH